MSNIISDTQKQVFNDSSRLLAPAAVGSQVALMSIISLVTIVLFNFLRPKNKIIYEPKVKYHEGDKPPPRISDSLFGWLPPLINTKEPELLDKIGLDAVTFLRFLRLMRWLFTGVSLLTCAVLLPINVTYNINNIESQNRDILSMLTIRDVHGNWLYAHVIVTYLITFLIVFFVDLHWRAVIRLRRTWFRSPEYLQSFYARTLQVRHVPKNMQSDEGIRAIFESVKVPYPTTSVHIGRKVGKLPDLIEYHNQTVREFEEVLVKYLKGGKIKANRPTIRVGGTCGIGGIRKDAIDHYTTKLQRTEAAIEEYRSQIDTRKAENYGFASMAAVPYAHVVVKMLRNKHPKGTKIELAPNPKDIIWANMNKSDAELAHKRLIGVIWLVAVCFFNTVPLLVISFLANLDSIRSYVPFLNSWATTSPQTFAIISGVLPPAVSGFFNFFLPVIMRWLAKYMGALTHSKLDRTVIARYFAFLVVSQLIIFTLIGVIFNSVHQVVTLVGKRASFKEIIGHLNQLPDVINRTYINQASYWLTYFPLRGFLVVFDLAQIINLVWLSFKTHVFGRTPRAIREWTQPPDFQYAIYYSNILFMGAVGLVFAPLSPLVVVAAAVVFWLSSWVYKYQLMFVFVSKVESGGRIWNVVINRLLVCVLLMQLLMILTMGLQLKFSSFQWIASIPPILIVFCYKIYINRVYLPAFNFFNPTDEELRMAKVYSERSDHKGNRLEKRFGHPALHTELFTPMLHKNMMSLLGQVYQGKIGKDKAKLDEYGGQQMEAQIVPGGIKIAAIDQHDLEYDPVLYQRDRGEADWDRRSIASTVILSDGRKSTYAPELTSKNWAYENYLSNGPGPQSDIELSQLDSAQSPLLDRRSIAMNQDALASAQSLTSPSIPQRSPSPLYVSTDNLSQTAVDRYPAPQHQRQLSGNLLAGQQTRSQSPGPYNTMNQYQYPSQAHSRQNSANLLGAAHNRPESVAQYQAYSPQQLPQHARQMSGNMLVQGGRQSPGPYQAYSGRSSPGPYQPYASQQSLHTRQTSTTVQSDVSPPGYMSRPPGLSQTDQQYHQHQQSLSSNDHNNVAGRGARGGYY